jgi:shikimate dehydrogenase
LTVTPSRPFKVAGIIGWPVAQSRSPKLHNYWLEHYGLPGTYVPLPVRPERLADALKGLSALGLAGCNVTIPHKLAVLQLVDRVDPVATRIGAANLIVVEQDGSLSAFNKDGYGFIQSLREARPDWRADAGPAVVLGAGGGARAVVISLALAGAQEIRLLNRTRDRAERLAADAGPQVRVASWEERAAALDGAALLVNTTSLGMTGQPAFDLALDRLPPSALVSDLIYNPLETALLAAARRRGNRAVNGLGMLLHQARPAFEAWFGVLPEVTPELRQAIDATIQPS